MPQTSPGLQVRALRQGGTEELTAVLAFDPGRPAAAQWEELRALLEATGAAIVAQEVFGAPGLELARGAQWPLTWVGDPDAPPELSGCIVTAIAAAAVEPLAIDGRVVGCAWTDGAARWCRLGGLRPARPLGSPAEEASATFALMDAALAQAGLAFADVVRTWYFNRDILRWYGDFNAARTAFFQRRKVFDGLVPASTGIGAPNSAGTALVAGLLAVRPVGEELEAQALASPLQCPAPQYGSSFSRAVELSSEGLKRILVSGTASIEPGGRSVHQGDFAAQVGLTLQVVHAILASRGAGFGDVVRGVAYLRRAEDLPAWRRLAAEAGLGSAPLVATRAEVCRDELLFELEVDAALAG